MARRRYNRKKPKTRSKYKSAFNIKSAAFAYAGLHLATTSLLNTTPYNFVASGYLNKESGSGYQSGMTGQPFWHTQITLKEIINGAQLGGNTTGAAGIMTQIKDNAMKNAPTFILGSIGLTMAQKVLTKAGVFRNTNKVIRALGMGNMVKV